MAPVQENGAPPAEELEPKSEDLDAEHEIDDVIDDRPKKRRRVIKIPDKKYECPQPDCGKSYSRAEHLYRHQLNHTPKQIYRCDFPGCDRHFVRADLCARHRERHTAKGSHLQRKDAFLNGAKPPHSKSNTAATSPTVSGTVSASPVEVNHSWTTSSPKMYNGLPPATSPQHSNMDQYQAAPANYGSMARLNTETAIALDPQLTGHGPYSASYVPNHTTASYTLSTTPDALAGAHRRMSYDSLFARPQSMTYSQSLTLNPVMHATATSSSGMPAPTYAGQPYSSPQPSNAFKSPSHFPSLPSLPPFGYPVGFQPPSSTRSNSVKSPHVSVHSSDQVPMPNSRSNSMVDVNALEQMANGYIMPVFGQDGVNNSPQYAMNDAFLASLFSSGDQTFEKLSGTMPPGLEQMNQNQPFGIDRTRIDAGSWPPEAPSAKNGAHASVQASNTLIDATKPESGISENKRKRLLDMIIDRFNDIDQMPNRKCKEALLAGDRDNDYTHVLSMHMMQTYIGSYWYHVHQQMPILHRPTFNSETVPEVLLLAMMALGAVCLEKTHSYQVTQNCAELSFFLAWHVRWEIFRDAEFRPTAKLWTFQAMLLLELFEKMYATRTLHERAHIHHATTLTVMRRGSSLIGRSALDSPSSSNDPTRTPPGPNGSINVSGTNTPDENWNRWITAEATRRAAFAAFVIDSTHATLFGHSAIMGVQDIKLPLPCDEALWSATSGAEVSRIEASHSQNGFKPTTFLDSLKNILNGRKVRTNTFGRVIIMAGLLNVSWHMNQRDLQVKSLGVSSTLGNEIKWRSPLTRAFDFWRRDFDDALAQTGHWMNACHEHDGPDKDNVFESRTVLHSLAHMAMHVDIVDCQIFAGADRLLGRSIMSSDRASAQKRMKQEWAPSARARDAVFYALHFLRAVLIPEDQFAQNRQHPHPPPSFTYSARDDFLLNRPWVLYFASLIVWAYGYALDGPIRPSNYTLTSRELQIFDMQRYLSRMGGVMTPDHLEKQRDRNNCLGLLLLLRDCFRQPRWELLHEASGMLGNCIEMLVPGSPEHAK